MADAPSPLVAIRVVRPYETADEFLEHEANSLTRSSIMLIGAPSRPKGTILRFEVVLASGGSLMRGEGRVSAFQENAWGAESGLTLRFTRLDARSKALLDRATVLREQAASQKDVHSHASSTSAPVLESKPAVESTPSLEDAPSIHLKPTGQIVTQRVPTSESMGSIPPVLRDELLKRLRERSNGLDPTQVAFILSQKRSASRNE